MELEELQKVNLRMAKYFVEFCKKHDLLCYFCGGGCIGAVRHKGFIPWDDDLDFFMPRESYERFKTLWKDTEKYVLTYPNESYNDHNMFMTLRDKTTTMIKPYQAHLDIPHGVVMDIFPLDGCPSSKWQRKTQLLWALVYQLYCSQMIPMNHGKLVKLAGQMALTVVCKKSWRYKIWRFAEKQMSKYNIVDSDYITELCAGPRYMKLAYPKSIFSSGKWVAFSCEKMPIPIGYDQYLTLAFGDYMKLPPEEQRVAPHEYYMDLKNPYIIYKGKKYLVD